MAPLIRHLGVLVALALAASCGSAEGDPDLAVPWDVEGRGHQPAWWAELPTVMPSNPGETVVAPAPLTLPADALFDIGDASVRPGELAAVIAFAEALTARADVTTTWWVVGATDSTGDANFELGLERARAVIDALTTVPGLDRARFIAASWGETCPAIDEGSAVDVAEARARNRRVVLLPDGASPPCPISK